MSNLTVNCPSWWNSPENLYHNSSTKNISFVEVGSLIPNCHEDDIEEDKYLVFQQPEKCSTQSSLLGAAALAPKGMSCGGKTNSSESVQDVSCGNNDECQVDNFMNGTDFVSILSKVDAVQSSMGCIPYPIMDPCFSAFYTPYGQQQQQVIPQMFGITTAGRLPLPFDLADDIGGPVYVNAKQYHGILRRRKVRAKLDAQHKLVKSRKRYLHESRHLHALNRARGSGGRFLSAKKGVETDSKKMKTESAQFHHSEFNGSSSGMMMATTTVNGGGGGGDVTMIRRLTGQMFAGDLSSPPQMVEKGTQNCVPIVR